MSAIRWSHGSAAHLRSARDAGRRTPLAATSTVGTRQSQEAERVLGDLITRNRLSVTSREGFVATFRSALVGSIRVVHHQYRNFAGSESIVPLGMVVMSVPVRGSLAFEMDGKKIIVPPGAPLVANVGDMPRMVGPATTDLLTLMVPASTLRDALESRFPRLSSGMPIVFGAMASRQSGGALAQAMWTIRDALDAGDAQSPQKQQQLSTMLVSSLLLAHPHNLTRELYLAGATASDSAVWDAVAVLRNAPESRVTIAELARDSGVSVRSLQLGFVRLIGVTPSEYQRNLRLDMAHDLIIRSDPRRRDTVAQIAAQVGYVNQGRFAADFARRFGRTPSAALRDRH